jgi:Domain of unknown function (DUF1918)
LTARRNNMKAKVGDKIVIKRHHLGKPERDALVPDVQGPNGEPPYLVRWAEDGHEGLFCAGTDASRVHLEQPDPS